MQDLVAGQIDLSFVAPFQLSLVRAGSIKAYAVTSDTRLAVAPDIPTWRDGAAGAVLLCLVRTFRAQGHAT
jgi:tripartite-type tricarboxylate transporter receptor subunit TctC